MPVVLHPYHHVMRSVVQAGMAMPSPLDPEGIRPGLVGPGGGGGRVIPFPRTKIGPAGRRDYRPITNPVRPVQRPPTVQFRQGEQDYGFFRFLGALAGVPALLAPYPKTEPRIWPSLGSASLANWSEAAFGASVQTGPISELLFDMIPSRAAYPRSATLSPVGFFYELQAMERSAGIPPLLITAPSEFIEAPEVVPFPFPGHQFAPYLERQGWRPWDVGQLGYEWEMPGATRRRHKQKKSRFSASTSASPFSNTAPDFGGKYDGKNWTFKDAGWAYNLERATQWQESPSKSYQDWQKLRKDYPKEWAKYGEKLGRYWRIDANTTGLEMIRSQAKQNYWRSVRSQRPQPPQPRKDLKSRTLIGTAIRLYDMYDETVEVFEAIAQGVIMSWEDDRFGPRSGNLKNAWNAFVYTAMTEGLGNAVQQFGGTAQVVAINPRRILYNLLWNEVEDRLYGIGPSVARGPAGEINQALGILGKYGIGPGGVQGHHDKLLQEAIGQFSNRKEEIYERFWKKAPWWD